MPTIRRFSIALLLVAAGFSIGFHVCASLSECCYVLIPPLAAAVWLTGVADLRQALRRGITVAGGLFAFGLGAAHLLLGRHAIGSWHVWTEVASCLYFACATVIVLLVVRRSLLSFAEALRDRWRPTPALRIVLFEVVPLGLFVLLALPYALAFAQVHRFKMPNLIDPQTARGRAFEEITFRSSDGVQLKGWWIPYQPEALARDGSAGTPALALRVGMPATKGKRSERTLIICHGISGNRSIFLPWAEVGDWLDANVLMFDMRGHGDSGGRTITLGYHEKEDVLAAIAFVRREKAGQAKQVFALGMSLGAAALAEAAPRVEPPLDAVILDSSFASTRDMTHAAVGPFPPYTHSWLLGLGLPMADWHAGCAMMAVRPETSIRTLRSPVLFLHSRDDFLIPSSHSERLHEHAPGTKQLVMFELPGHCDAFFHQRERYREAVTAFCVANANGGQ